MRFFRSERVSELIREELGKLILREMEFPNTLVTITAVEVTKKMESAKVEVSVIPSEKGEAALAVLRGATGYLQHLLMKKINIKPMPQIAFALDRGLENAAAVEKVLIEEDLEGGERKQED